MSKRIAFFNHKGGVSKTTSVYNIGWALAKTKRVLLVDADSQCNLSSLLLGDGFEQYYSDENTSRQNIKDGVRVAFEGKPSPISPVECYSPHQSPNLFLMAGHATLSEYDAALTFAQTSNNAITTLQNLPGAFAELLKQTETQFDIEYTLIDMNPSLSAINQNLFTISDAFIIPTNPDPFSIMALQALQSTLPRWCRNARSMRSIFGDSAYPLPDVTPRFVGSLIQRFNIRNGRAAKPYRDNIAEIKNITETCLFPALAAEQMIFTVEQYHDANVAEGHCLSEISDFQGLLPKAYNAGVPVFALSDAEIGEAGVVLEGLIEKRDHYKQQFEAIAQSVTHLI